MSQTVDLERQGPQKQSRGSLTTWSVAFFFTASPNSHYCLLLLLLLPLPLPVLLLLLPPPIKFLQDYSERQRTTTVTESVPPAHLFRPS